MAKRSVLGVFSGGGMKAAAFLGAIEEAQKHVQFVGWGGTSAGSIVATFLACGFTLSELDKVLCEAPYGDFFRVNPTMVLVFKHYRGIVDPKPLLTWLRDCIGEKFPEHSSRVDFRHLNDNQLLKIVATNIATQDTKIYSKIQTPDIEIAQAILASCSFPLFFPPVKQGEDELVDGGVLSNFPMWLFDDERESQTEFTPVLGFTLVTKAKKNKKASALSYAYSVFESVLAAQDRIQERYADTSRLANVVRIRIEPTSTFDASRTPADHDSLKLAGMRSASSYFASATTNYGKRVNAPNLPATENARAHLERGDYPGALSEIARQHILHGGVARDDGQLVDRVLVRYYIDLMEAVTYHDKLDILVQLLANQLGAPDSFDRVVGIKKGNVILSHAVARLVKKPITIFKSDMSYKMGPPFDGPIHQMDRVVLVDDIASDASVLLNAIRHLNFHKAKVLGVVTLIERIEGDARSRLNDKNVQLESICCVDDSAVDDLIYRHSPLSKR